MDGPGAPRAAGSDWRGSGLSRNFADFSSGADASSSSSEHHANHSQQQQHKAGVPPGVVSLVNRGAPGTPTGAGGSSASGGLRTPGAPSHSASAAAATAMLSAMTSSSRPGTAASTPAAGAGGGANSFSGGATSSRPNTAAYHSASGEAPAGGQQPAGEGASRPSNLRPHLAIDLATANSMSVPSDMPPSPGSAGRPPLVTSRARSNHLPSNLGELGLGEQVVLLDSQTAHLRQIAALRQELEDQRGLIARLRRQLDESDSRWGPCGGEKGNRGRGRSIYQPADWAGTCSDSTSRRVMLCHACRWYVLEHHKLQGHILVHGEWRHAWSRNGEGV
jgi:hypothetical protein